MDMLHCQQKSPVEFFVQSSLLLFVSTLLGQQEARNQTDGLGDVVFLPISVATRIVSTCLTFQAFPVPLSKLAGLVHLSWPEWP